MNLESRQLHTIAVTVCLALIGLNADAQKRRSAPAKYTPANSASHVSAEMTKGTLKPSETKPGDEVALRLKDDVKTDGDVVLEKGTTITGIVRNVKRVETKGQAQSMMEIEWFAPPLQSKVARQLSIALQAVTEISPTYGRTSVEKRRPISVHRFRGRSKYNGVARDRPSECSIVEYAVCHCCGYKNRIQSGIELWHVFDTVVQSWPQRMDYGRRIETVRGPIFTFEQRHDDHVSQQGLRDLRRRSNATSGWSE